MICLYLPLGCWIALGVCVLARFALFVRGILQDSDLTSLGM